MRRIFNFQFSIFNLTLHIRHSGKRSASRICSTRDPGQARMTVFRNISYNKQNGFTLIELLVVISIIGILSGLLYGVFSGVQMRARDGQRKADLRSIQHALEQYRADQGTYPSTLAQPNCPATQITSSSPCSIVYMQKIPLDPSLFNSGNYYYSPLNSNLGYKLVSCIENANDADTNVVAIPPSGFTCPSGVTKYYLLNNP